MHNLLYFYAFIFGCCVGSFLNVLIIRLPQKIDFVAVRSRCPSCLTQLKWFHNIPVFSFVFLKGKCAYCHTRISWRYPLVEIFTGLVAFWLMPSSLSVETVGLFLFYFSIACVFICHFLIDIDHHLLLDSLNLYLLAIILPYAVVTRPWEYWVLGGVIGFGAPLLVTWLFYKIRGQVGLGGGDIKLFGILGLLFGPIGIILTIFLSCFVGALFGIGMILIKKMSKEKPLAFGPAILLVATLQLYFPKIFNFVQSFFF